MFTPNDYLIIAQVLPRLLGIIYLFAIGALLFQIKGLIGKNGLLPLPRYLKHLRQYFKNKPYFYMPTLFWLNSSDKTLIGLTTLGTFFAFCLIGGLYPSLMLFLLYIIYLSLIVAGQDFLSFGWEGLLLEITAHVFLLSLAPSPNLIVWLSINFLLFRFHFQAGLVKLKSGDPNWRNLTAIAYHYQTQPLPNAIAWYAYHLPLGFHKFSALMVFAIELILPFGIFGSEDLRTWVFIGFFSLQFMIWVTGNFSYLNHMTVVLSTILLGDATLSKWFSFSLAVSGPTPLLLDLTLSLLGALLLGLQLIRLWHQILPNTFLKKILQCFAPFHLANRYTIFANMTTERYEIIIEGSQDGSIWKEYTFKYKPSEVNKRPRRIAPYQPRLDWQTWFLPFTSFQDEEWFQSLLFHLLKGTPEVIRLLHDVPFHNPPLYMRALIYKYEFSRWEDKKRWWQRQLIGPYSPIIKLKNK